MLCWLAWFSLKSHPFCPLECACPGRRLGGVFPFQNHHCWWCCSFARWHPCPHCPRARRCAQPALAPGLEPALGFLAAIWHVLSIFVLTPFPFLEHFPGWEIQSEAAPGGSAASREVCQPRAGRARIGRFRSRLLLHPVPPAQPGLCCSGAPSMGCLCLPISPGEHSQDSCLFSNLAIPVHDSSSPTERRKGKTR